MSLVFTFKTRRLRVALLLAFAGSLTVLPRNRTGPDLPVFTDIAQQSGIRFRNLSGAPEKNYIFEAKGGGLALLDYDQDGFLDIYFTNGNTIEDLAKASPEDLASKLKIAPYFTGQWIENAKKIVTKS